MQISIRRFLPAPLSATLLAVILCFAFSPQAMSEEQDDKPAKRSSKEPSIDEATLRTLLPGTWSWKLPKDEDGNTPSVLVSFDGDLNVVGTARMTNGAALAISPSSKPVRITLLQDAETGLKSPATGSILKLTMPGIWDKPVRFLVKSATRKKLECIDLADTENPNKITLTKTTDRLLKEIEGPGQTSITQAPSEPPQPAAAPTPAPQPTLPPAPSPVVTKRQPERPPLMSVFERIKAEQAEKVTEESTKEEPPPAPTPPAQPASETSSPSLRDILIQRRPPRISLHDRLKAEQAEKAANDAQPSTKPPPVRASESNNTSLRDILVQRRRPHLSLFDRLKAEQAEKAAAPKSEQAPAKDPPTIENAPPKSP